jgi:hypothetical protein
LINQELLIREPRLQDISDVRRSVRLRLQINGNPEVSGRLDDPKILSIIKGWPKLKFLDFGNLPKLTGSLPQQCPPPLDNLEHLSIASTQVGGTIPACLLNTVHQLEISHSSVTGPLPAFEPTNQLRCVHTLLGSGITLSLQSTCMW